MWKRDTERSIIKMNRMTFDLSLIQNLHSAECDEATLVLFAGRSQPVLDGGESRVVGGAALRYPGSHWEGPDRST